MNGNQRCFAVSVFCLTSALFTAGLSPTVLASAPTLKLDVGAYYSEGDYSLKESTRISGAPLSIRYRGWPWKIKLSTMWVGLDGPGTLSDGDVSNDRDDVRRNESGMGDTSLTLEREGVFGQAHHWYWNLGMRVKFPTGDEKKGLGTGEFDYEPRFTLMYLAWPMKPYLMGKYTLKGDDKANPYENTLGATLGASYAPIEDFTLGLQFSGRQASVEDGQGRLEALVNGEYRLDRQWKVGAYMIKGLKDGSPDWGSGVTLSYEWGL